MFCRNLFSWENRLSIFLKRNLINNLRLYIGESYAYHISRWQSKRIYTKCCLIDDQRMEIHLSVCVLYIIGWSDIERVLETVWNWKCNYPHSFSSLRVERQASDTQNEIERRRRAESVLLCSCCPIIYLHGKDVDVKIPHAP